MQPKYNDQGPPKQEKWMKQTASEGMEWFGRKGNTSRENDCQEQHWGSAAKGEFLLTSPKVPQALKEPIRKNRPQVKPTPRKIKNTPEQEKCKEHKEKGPITQQNMKMENEQKKFPIKKS